MWQLHSEPLADATRYTITRDEGIALSFREWLALLERDDDFARWYSAQLAKSAAPAVFWEHPPLCLDTLDRALEFVLVPSTSLAAIDADPSAFAEHFDRATTAEVVSFDNLRGDATLICPAPRAAPQAYAHLASFVRHAPEAQQRELWRRVATELRAKLSARPLWLSTAGMGVSWLHVRLDAQPKYYRFAPYKRSGA